MTLRARGLDRVFLLIALLPLACSVAANQGPQVVSAAALASEIKSKGPGPVLRELETHPDHWAEALGQVSKGEPVWLEIAASLRRVSDAGSSEDLELAVAEAVEHQPAAVLATLGRPFEVQAVCGNEESLGRDFKKAIAVLQRRRAALVQVAEKAVQHEKARCIEALDVLTNQVKTHRREWFGHE